MSRVAHPATLNPEPSYRDWRAAAFKALHKKLSPPALATIREGLLTMLRAWPQPSAGCISFVRKWTAQWRLLLQGTPDKFHVVNATTGGPITPLAIWDDAHHTTSTGYAYPRT